MKQWRRHLAFLLLASLPPHGQAAIDGVKAARESGEGLRLKLDTTLPGSLPAVPKENAGPDANLGRLAASAPVAALRWINVRGDRSDRYFIGGPSPGRDRERGWHAIALIDDAETMLLLPANGLLRIVGDADNALPPQLFASNGTGASVAQPLIPGTDGRSWLFSSTISHPLVVRLRRPPDAPKRYRIALFVARIDTPPNVIVYRNELALPPPTHQLRAADEAVARPHAWLEAGKPLELDVEGPNRLLLDYRTTVAELPPRTLIGLDVLINGIPAKTVRQPTGEENDVPVSIDGTWRATGRREQLTVTIPPGKHRLTLRATHPLLLRAATTDGSDFLLPAANLPQAWRKKPAASADAIEQFEQEAVAAATSNRWRDIGMLAADALDRTAARQPGADEVQRAAARLAAQASFYRDLPPTNPSSEAHDQAVRANSYLLQTPRSPVAPPQVRIENAERAPDQEPLPVALFHRIGAQALRYRLPPVPHRLRLRAIAAETAERPATLEATFDNGTSMILKIGAPPPEASALLEPAGEVGMASASGVWPSTLSGAADRAGAVAPLAATGSVEFDVPPGARSVSIRAVDGAPSLLLQWLGSADYAIDDTILAELAQTGGTPAAIRPLVEDARRMLARRLAAARAEFAANIVPAVHDRERVDETAARQAASKASAQSDPVRAVELWSLALRTADPQQRAAALQGLANGLLGAGERFAAERLLRAHWLGDDGATAKAAETALQALYAREQDQAAQLLFAAVKAERDPGALAELARQFAAAGEDGLALLAGLSASDRPLAALLNSALRSRNWQTFATLLGQLSTPEERYYWQAQRALSDGDIAAAEALFRDTGETQWAQALEQSRQIAGTLANDASAGHAQAVAEWLDWQQAHPGPYIWREEPVMLQAHGGGKTLRSVALNLRGIWWQAKEGTPLTVQVVGPARIRVEARPLHASPESLASGWLRIRGPGMLWMQPFSQNQISPGLTLDDETAYPGAAVTRELSLPTGVHRLRIDAGAVPVIARVQVERPALQIPVLPAPTVAHFARDAGRRAVKQPAPDCGSQNGCHLRAGERLGAYSLSLVGTAPANLPAPKPAPASARDAVATHLFAGDIDAALANATDPLEKMRLLLWMAEHRPAQRARAIALGATLAREHPIAEIQSLWSRIEARSSWQRISLVERSAGIRPVERAPGMPSSPASRLRAALLPPLRPQELRISGETRAALALDLPDATTLKVAMEAETMPGIVPVPVTVHVERDGKPYRVLTLTAEHSAGNSSGGENPGSPQRTVSIPLAAGQRRVAVRLETPYANQSLRVRFSGLADALPLRSEDWHIATASEPVRVAVTGPAWLRIDRLDSDGVRSEERLVSDANGTVVLPPQKGKRESLYRIYQRTVSERPPPERPPLPNRYRPQEVPAAPAPWQTTAAKEAEQVTFVDGMRLGAINAGTWTLRGSVQKWRDTEASGGNRDVRQERYLETGVAWRRRDAYSQRGEFAEIIVRDPDDGAAVFGFALAADRNKEWSAAFPWPLDLSASLVGFAQHTPYGTGLSLTASATASQTRMLTPRLSHTPTATVTARAMSLNNLPDNTQVDTDVYTRYRDQHRFALNLGDTLSWRPYRDSHLAARGYVVTNPNLNLLRPDHIGADMLGRQLVGPLMLEAGGRVIRYLPDPDRFRGVTRRELRLGLVWDYWLGDGSRLESRAALRYDVDTRQNWGGIELRWHWGPGRDFRDFRPGELDFRDLRSWRIPAADNGLEMK